MSDLTSAQEEAAMEALGEAQIEEYLLQQRDPWHEVPDLPIPCAWCGGSGLANVVGPCFCCHGEGMCYPNDQCRKVESQQ
jgi:RecJ-like exonuclease